MDRLLFLLLAWLAPGATNTAPTFAADISQYIQEEVEPLARRQLVAYQFGRPLYLETNRGTTYIASRYERLNLPYAPLQEGVAPPGAAMTLRQVTGTAQQWGDRVIVTDVANLTIAHPLFQQAIQLVALEVAETVERNTLNNLLAGTQVNYVNKRTSRANLIAGDILTPHEANRIVASLTQFGAPRFMGDEREDMMIDAGAFRESKSPAAMPHYVALISPLVSNDMRENSQIASAWSFSDVNRLYNNELGSWGGARYVETNMMPFWTGQAQITGTPGTAGSLATNNYFIQVTAAPALTSVEQNVYQVSGSLSVTGPNGSVSVVLPSLPGYVFSVYIGTTSSPVNLGLCASGPTTGSLAGQATQLAGGQTVIITGVGASQTPPAAPATGVTVFPTIFLGNHSYGQVILENPQFYYLRDADKSDPNNQTRVVSWKIFYGTMILNQGFFARVESASNFTAGFDAGTVAYP